MDQVLAIRKVREKIDRIIAGLGQDDPVKASLLEIYNDLEVFHDKGIDFKDVVDTIDDSICISDDTGRVIYVNPAYEAHTGISPEEILGRNVADIVREGVLFTGGATLDVMKEHKKVFRLSTTFKSSPPQVGYTIGVPLLDNDGVLKQVVVTSRPIVTLGALQEDFGVFLAELSHVRENARPVRILNETETLLKSRNLVGASRLDTIWPVIERAACTDATVLITGESGVGKEVIADEIVARSDRKNKPYVKVNCAAIPDTLLESELFGYAKGAFSGASTAGKPGIFEMGNHGTVLLDEIGDMPVDMQVKLLRALQNRQIIRVGGTKAVDLDIRFIALTNSNLKEKIDAGLFRRDLFYRLSVLPLQLPPLRERLDDLKDLCSHFINKYSQKYQRYISLSQKQLDMMKLHDWPGNIRELENVIEYLVVCSSGTGEVEDAVLRGILNIASRPEAEETVYDLAEAVGRYERELIEKVLTVSANLREAGALLNVNASTISRKIKQYGIPYPAKKKQA